MLGDVYNKVADIGYGIMFSTVEEYWPFQDPSIWYTIDRICFMAQKPDKYPKILALLQPMDRLTWLGAGLSVTVFLLFYIFYAMLETQR